MTVHRHRSRSGDPPPYRLLAQVLRACVIPDGAPAPAPDDRLRAINELSAWLESELKSHETPVYLTPEETNTNLQAAALELLEVAEANPDEPKEDELPTVRQIRFFDHLIRLPPTNIHTLARAFRVTTETILEWLSDEPPDTTTREIGEYLLHHLLELSATPEAPSRAVPVEPLVSFSDLAYLGTLRQALAALYNNSPPKPAQSAYIPRIIRNLDQCFHHGRGGRFVVVAPTNGGKNGMILVAALAAVAWDRGPAIVLQPYRAQVAESREAWREAVEGRPIFRQNQAPRGLRIAGSSAIISDADKKILNGRIDISSIIPEKLSILSRTQPLSSFCRFLVCDEIAHLLDRQRGPKLEIVLTLAKQAGLPIMATGAGLPEEAANKISRWLADLPDTSDARSTGALIYDANIPRDPPLEHWVWRRDGERRRAGSYQLESVEPFEGSLEEAVSDLILRQLTADPDRQILVFMESRERVVLLAAEVARRLRESPEYLLAQLDKAAADSHRDPLESIWLGGELPSAVDVSSILAQRVGVHTRDVPSNNLARIEKSFREGRLRVLCATTTVEAGINLPVDTVIQVGIKDHMGEELSPRSLEQRFGRAGRTLRGVSRTGRGIIYIDNPTFLIDRVIVTKLRRRDPHAESALDANYRALLLLVTLSAPDNPEGLDEDSLRSALATSFWAHNRTQSDISNRASQAIAMLAERSLIVRDDVSLRPTSLGRALAAALLPPSDADHIAQILDAARNTPADSSWMPEVLLAANSVPSLLLNNRRPRATDIVRRGGLDSYRILGSWIFQDSTREKVLFGFPEPHYKKMRLGRSLEEITNALQEGPILESKIKALLRTYILWLWTSGEEVDVRKHVSNLSEHVVRQDLADYASHVVRCASWFAQYEGLFLLGLRLGQLARQIEYGTRAEALDFFSVCHEHVSRSSVAAHGSTDFGQLLENIEPKLGKNLRDIIDHRRDAHFSIQIENALESQGADHDNKVWFLRIENIESVERLLVGVWASGGRALRVVDREHIALGSLTARLAHSLDVEPHGNIDFLIYSLQLTGKLQYSRRALDCSVLGTEELATLVACLSGMTEWQQDVLLETLASCRRVCFGALTRAVAQEILGNPQLSPLRELDEPSEGKKAELIQLLLRRISPLFGDEAGSNYTKAFLLRGSMNSEFDRVVGHLGWVLEKLDAFLRKAESDREDIIGADPTGERPAAHLRLRQIRDQLLRARTLQQRLASVRTREEATQLASAIDALGAESMTQLGWESLINPRSDSIEGRSRPDARP